ncbi:putative transcriptional regulator with HTH domain [Pseudomonas sp. GM50]|uniref:ATP-binding protein n=1 Tax=Pseudomonas sp. GM50 TaxID=1144332 RepID=UPI000270B7B9|nr:ATP-binding protein [Pseudomonas sp. GM50]EJM68817.1 putative transcriptional regulator with HTH domain [Pseudomonas sp. GM50]
MDELLSTLRYKSEGTDIDFKSAQYRFIGGSEIDKAEMLKDILAIANSWRDGPGYILLGFKDQRPHPAEVVGISGGIDDAAVQQFVHGKVKPKLTFRYEEHLYEGKTVGVITIPKQKRAFYLSHAYGKLKSNVVYVRRGSSTDEAEPPEITAMTLADSGRGEMNVDLSLLTLHNKVLPNNYTHQFLQFTEEFPDYKRRALGPAEFETRSFMTRDNEDFWREYAEYVQVNDALIQIQFILLNRSEVQLSNAKLEVIVEPLDGQSVDLLAGCDLPEKPETTWDISKGLRTLPEVMANQNARLIIDESAIVPVCHIRFGSLLPGEEARSCDALAIVPLASGKLRLRCRILASELATPIEMDRMIQVTGSVVQLDFQGFKSLMRERWGQTDSIT